MSDATSSLRDTIEGVQLGLRMAELHTAEPGLKAPLIDSFRRFEWSRYFYRHLSSAPRRDTASPMADHDLQPRSKGRLGTAFDRMKYSHAGESHRPVIVGSLDQQVDGQSPLLAMTL